MTLVRRLAIALSCAIVVSACAGSRVKKDKYEQGEVVIAEGLAPYKAEDLPGTKAAALAAAQRSAVELVVGVYVTAKTRVEKAVAIEQNILTKTTGYVKKYEIIKEGQDGPWYKTKIRALVATKDIREDLEDLGALRQPAIGNPRVAIRLLEYVGEKENKDGRARNALTQALLDRGFKVVELPRSVQMDDDPVDVARGLGGKAEILMAGLARAQDLGYDKTFGGMSSFRASVSVRVIEAGSGEIISSVSETASGLEATSDIAAGKALQKAAEMAGKALSNLPQELAKRSHVDLTINGLKSFAELSRFQKSLTAEPGVKDLFLRSYSQESGVAILDVSMDQMSPQDLADRAAAIGGAGWSVYQVAGRAVQLSASEAGR